MNSSLIIFLSALLPAVGLMAYTVWRDRKRPEPAKQLIRGFGYGISSVFVSLTMSQPAMAIGLVPAENVTTWDAVWTAFGAAAIPEELAKLLMLWWLLRKNECFDEYFDGVVYAVCVGLGFAAFENIMYLFEAAPDDWIRVAIVRGLFSVPGHYCFAVLMGYYYSLVHFGHNSMRNTILVIAAPILAHGIFDALLMVSGVENLAGIVSLLFMIAFLGFSIQLRKLCQNRIAALIERDNYVRDEGYYRA